MTASLLLFTKHKFLNLDKFEPEPEKHEKFKLKPSFVFHIIGISVFAFGFVDYSLVGMHIGKVYIGNSFIITDATLPLIYSGAMIVDAIAAVIFGKLYDRFGMFSLAGATLASCLFSLFIFEFNPLPMLFVGVAMWGIGMGAQESILKAAVTSMVPKDSQTTRYGMFEFSFGIFWFLGSWLRVCSVMSPFLRWSSSRSPHRRSPSLATSSPSCDQKKKRLSPSKRKNSNRTSTEKKRRVRILSRKNSSHIFRMVIIALQL